VGENLAAEANTEYTEHNMSRLTIAKNSMKRWFDEKAVYNYDTNTCAPEKECGHYT